MVEYYLDDDYDRWIANFLTDVCNDPHDIYIIKKEIQDAWDQRSEVNQKGGLMKYIIIIIFLLTACNKVDIDPSTTILKQVITNGKN